MEEKYLHLTEIEKSQIAMAIDCEGCISVTPTLLKKHWAFSTKTFIANTNLIFLNWINNLIGLGNVVFVHKSPKYKGIYVTDNWKKQYIWVIYATDMRKLLPIIYPYLIIKKDIALLTIEFLSLTKGKGYHLNEVQQIRRLEIFNELRKLNWRGTTEFIPFNFDRIK